MLSTSCKSNVKDIDDELKNRLVEIVYENQRHINSLIVEDLPWLNIRHRDVYIHPHPAGYNLQVKCFMLLPIQMGEIPHRKLSLYEFDMVYYKEYDVCTTTESWHEIRDRVVKTLTDIDMMFRIYDWESVQSWPFWKLKKYLYWRIKTGAMSITDAKVIDKVLERISK